MQLFCNTCQKITFHSELSSSGTTIQYHQCDACGEIPEVSISQPTSKTTATKGRWKTVTIPEDKGMPTFYSPRVSMPNQNSKPHEVTIKDLAREIYVSGFRKGFNSKDKNVVVDFSKETSKYVADLLTLISECVGEEEETPHSQNMQHCNCIPCRTIARRNNLRDEINSAISKRSGLKEDGK